VKYILTFLLLVFLFRVDLLKATPAQVEVWFLSPKEEKSFSHYLLRSANLLAVVDASTSGVMMGDGWFHPQLGYIPSQKSVAKENDFLEAPKLELKTFNSDQTELVDCKKDYYFDMYCGSSGGKINDSEKTGVGLWIDHSTSLRQIDDENCHRKKFVDEILKECPSIQVAVYHTRLAEISSRGTDVICEYRGLNDTRALISWIEASTLKQLFIVTDRDEISSELLSYLQSIGGTIVGEYRALYPGDLLGRSSQIIKLCQ